MAIDTSPFESKYTKIEELPDGTAIYGIEEVEEELEDEVSFASNLADEVPEASLNKLVGDLLEGIDRDIESRKEWEVSFNRGMKYLGFKVEEFRDYPFNRACSAYDSTLSTALLRFWSTARAELFPSVGPANFKILGDSSDELEVKGDKLKRFINNYLTQEDKDYYPDSERMLMYLGIVGCGFRKVYQDPLTNRPLARMIDPQDFIVNNDCVSILSSDRLTHTLFLTKKEIMLRQELGYYRDGDIPISSEDYEEMSSTTKTVKNIEGVKNNGDNKSLIKIYEVHADLYIEGLEDKKDTDKSESGMPRPYIVTICVPTKKVLSIRRNWKEDDKLYKRIEYFVQYNYLPGFGIYGIGLSQLLGSNSLALTSVLRQLIDAGTLKNFPGGLKQKGLRVETNDKAIGPSEFWDVETGGMPIGDAIMLMPYNEPSIVLKELRNELIQQVQQLANTADTQISDSKAETPVGTTLAMLEVNNKVQSSVLRSQHVSLSNELELLTSLFRDGLDSETTFDVEGASLTIQKEDFHQNIRIVPVSDPNLTTSTQRILRAEAILRLAQSAPQIHDLRNAYHRIYAAMNVEDIDRLLPPEEQAIGLDPITENMNALENKPLKVEMWQDHQSHMITHMQFMESNPDIGPTMMAHIATHRAYDYYIKMQMEMQQQMPALEMLKNPEIQNQIALQSAEASIQMQQKQEQSNPKPPDPNEVMMADIEARIEAAILKSEESKLRAETEAYKAKLKYESEMTKLDAQQEMAEEKNEVDVTLAIMKQESAEDLAEMKIESSESLAKMKSGDR